MVASKIKLIFLMQNHAYFLLNMHTAQIYTKKYTNAKKSQVNTVRQSHLPAANYVYQQLSSVERLHLARTRPVRQCGVPASPAHGLHRPHTACSPPVPLTHAVRTTCTARITCDACTARALPTHATHT